MAATTSDQLIALLRRHPSIPPSGKGEQPLPLERTKSDDEGEAEAEAVEAEEAARLGEELPASPIYTCVFRDLTCGLGIIFSTHNESSLLVVAFCPLSNGQLGPATVMGESIAPGDVVISANGEASLLQERLTETGQLGLGPAKTLELRFQRPKRAPITALGGRPAALRPKHNWRARKARLLGEESAGRDAGSSSSSPAPARARAGGLGGAPARLGSKTTKGHSRASQLPSKPPPIRCPDAPSRAAFDFHMHLVDERGAKLLAEMLANAELAEERQRVRDTEMAESAYID